MQGLVAFVVQTAPAREGFVDKVALGTCDPAYSQLFLWGVSWGANYQFYQRRWRVLLLVILNMDTCWHEDGLEQ